jgi:beta-N-acetylhexosaminidase
MRKISQLVSLLLWNWLGVVLFLHLPTVALAIPELQDLSLEQKVGQLLIVGFQGTELDAVTRKHFESIKPGAIILFKRNIATPFQTSLLNQSLQDMANRSARVPLLLAVDQEGGNVVRIPTDPLLPSAHALGASNDPKLLFSFGRETGTVLKNLGFNMNLAPVLDLGSYQWDFLGTRVFSTNPQTVAQLGTKFAEGLLSAGILPTAKHYPGAGGVKADTHLTRVMASNPENDQKVPFQEFAQIYPSAIMMSHVAYTALDPSGLPASLSHKIISEKLRQELNFAGLVVTDDLLMKGVQVDGSLEKTALRAVLAGDDLIMLSWSRRDQWHVYQYLLRAARNGTLPQSTLDEKVSRILKIKKILAANQMPPKHFPGWASPRLASLNDALLDNILANSSLKSLAVSPETQFSVFSSSANFTEQLRRSLGQTPETFTFDMKNASQLRRTVSSRLSDHRRVLIFLVQSKAQYQWISKVTNQLPAEQLSRSLIVNIAGPEQELTKQKRHQIDAFFQFPHLGWEVGKALRGLSEPSLRPPTQALLSTEQSRVESGPNPYHPESRSPASPLRPSIYPEQF